MNIIDKDNWMEVKGNIKNMDSIMIHSFSDFANDADDLKVKLEECYNKQILIKVNNSFIDPNEYIELIKMFDLATKQKIDEQKAARLTGIKKALELKKAGLGKYGRPTIKLPKDFEKQINCYCELKIPLENYRKLINMKKSTFYKYVKKVKK